MNRYSNPRDTAPWEASGLEMDLGDQEHERMPTDANFPIISQTVYYFNVTNNLEFNTNGDGRGIVVNTKPPILYEREKETILTNWKILLK